MSFFAFDFPLRHLLSTQPFLSGLSISCHIIIKLLPLFVIFISWQPGIRMTLSTCLRHSIRLRNVILASDWQRKIKQRIWEAKMVTHGMQNICPISWTNLTTPTGRGPTQSPPQPITRNIIDTTPPMTTFLKLLKIIKMFQSLGIRKSTL